MMGKKEFTMGDDDGFLQTNSKAPVVQSYSILLRYYPLIDKT